jgi:hypothetical protein
MINKIVKLKDGRSVCRILDSILASGNTYYMAIDFESSKIIFINPHSIIDIIDNNYNSELISISDLIIKNGL